MSYSKVIFIVGYIPSIISFSTLSRFKIVQIQLEKLGYKVYNPINEIVKAKGNLELAQKKNLEKLIQSDAVYVLNDETHLLLSSLDLAIAFRLNHSILHQPIFINLQDDSETFLFQTINN